MKSIVIYESKYGSTKKYAKWIGDELNCRVLDISDINFDDLLNYDNIIFGGWLHAGNIKGFSKIYKNNIKLKSKNIIVFYVGLSIENTEELKEIRKNNFKDMENIESFYLRGAFDFDKLTKADKVMMNMFKLMLKKQKEEDRDENTRGMLDAYITPVDFTDKSNIKPIVQFINNLSK